MWEALKNQFTRLYNLSNYCELKIVDSAEILNSMLSEIWV